MFQTLLMDNNDNRRVIRHMIRDAGGLKMTKGQTDKNGGQMAQEWLISEGVILHRLKCSSEDEQQSPGKKLKGLGGEISIATPEMTENLKEKLN